MLVLLNYTSASLQHDIKLTQDIGKINEDVLQLRRHEKDFLAYKDLTYADSFNATIKILNNNLQHLENNLIEINSNGTEPQQLQSILRKYQQRFQEVVNTQKNHWSYPNKRFIWQFKKCGT
tara:strand:+ start:8663 stop:9025 length:363 start_codon:yes stop_codon:yes gene_type:complete